MGTLPPPTGGIVDAVTGGIVVVGKTLGGGIGTIPPPTGGIVDPPVIGALEAVTGTVIAGAGVIFSEGAMEGVIVIFVTVGAYVVGA